MPYWQAGLYAGYSAFLVYRNREKESMITEKELDSYLGKNVEVEIAMVCEGGDEKRASFTGVLTKDENFGFYLLRCKSEEILLMQDDVKNIKPVK